MLAAKAEKIIFPQSFVKFFPDKSLKGSLLMVSEKRPES
jgi:hypothetical protein